MTRPAATQAGLEKGVDKAFTVYTVNPSQHNKYIYRGKVLI